MRDKTFSFDPGAAMLLGLLIFTLQWQELFALLTAAAFHELGHFVALKWMGVPVYRFSISASGPVLYCGESESRGEKVISALSGPAAGVGLWFICRDVWPLCAELSLFLSLVNLLPVYPLDGGRALFEFSQSRRLILVFRFLVLTIVLLAGLLAVKEGYGIGLTAFGIWLMLLACQGDENDIK